MNVRIMRVMYRKRICDLFFFIYITTFILFLGFMDKGFVLEQYLKNITYSLVIAFCLFLASLLFAQKGRVIFLSAALASTLVQSVIILSYLIIGHTFFVQNNFFSIFETSFRESKEFITAYVDWRVILSLILYFCFPILYIIKTKKENLKFTYIRIAKMKVHYVFIFLFCVVFIFTPYFKHYQYRAECAPFTSFYISYYKHNLFISKVKKYDASRKDINFHIETNMPDDVAKTFVIVIGESLSRKHMSIYGYPRNTTPLLNLMKDELLVFNDVTSPDSFTMECLKVMLTFATNEDIEAYFTKPSIIELFNYVNYETYVINNQSTVEYVNSQYGILATKAKHLIDMTRKTNKAHEYDEVVLPVLTDILKNNSNQNKVIFIHLLGSHVHYKERFPDSYKKFDNSYPFGVTKINLNDNQKKIINEYDNSVLYNDFVISSIIDLTRKYAPFSYVLYFSDHAQELFDIEDFHGHARRHSKYECNIPFILWRSEDYKQQIKLCEDNINTPYTTEDLIYSISQLSGLRYEEYDSAKSIFSDQFKSKKRMVGHIPYDDLRD